MEEQFVLRIQDRAAAEKLRGVLRGTQQVAGPGTGIEIKFDDPEPGAWPGREGSFVLDGQSYPLTLLDLPTVVESYKTLDDVHLVKSTDIGQMLLVREAGSAPPTGAEAKNGVTPPMRNARRRHFRQTPSVDAATIKHVEDALIAIASGHAPPDCEFEDQEEEFQVDAAGNGRWVPLQRAQHLPAAEAAGRAPKAKQAKPPKAKRPKPEGPTQSGVEEF